MLLFYLCTLILSETNSMYKYHMDNIDNFTYMMIYVIINIFSK